MASDFPSTLDSFDTLVDNADDVLASHQNNRGDAIENIQAKLGVNDSNVTSTIDYFLKHIDGAYRTHVHNGTSNDGAVIPHSNLSGVGSSDHHVKYALTDDLTSGEITQIQNIDSITISNTQWGYLGTLDQNLTSTSKPTFTDLTVTSITILMGKTRV